MTSDKWAVICLALTFVAFVTGLWIGMRIGEQSRGEENSWLDGTGGGGADATSPDPMPAMPSARAPGASVPAWPAEASSWAGRMPEHGEQLLIPQLTQDMAQLRNDISQQFDRILDDVWADAPPAARHLRAVE